MYYLYFFITSIFFLNACSQNFQQNGLSNKKLNNLELVIGETSKKYLTEKYGPPIFEDIFNQNVIYYVSHDTSYKTFEKRKTNKLLVFEITLDNKNIVQDFKKYTKKDNFDLIISKNEDSSGINFKMFWRDIINAMRRRNIEN
tara:strand:- start:96 stop:524 length:429 start_codon:yes stop_codon:yes gene_type:complete